MPFSVIGTSLSDVWSPTGSIDDLLDATGDIDCCCGGDEGCCPLTLIPSTISTAGTVLQIELMEDGTGCFTVGATDTMKDNWPAIEQYNLWTTFHDPSTGFFGDTEWAGVELQCFEDVNGPRLYLGWRKPGDYLEGPCPLSADGGGGAEWTQVSLTCDPFVAEFTYDLNLIDELICLCPDMPAVGQLKVRITATP